MVSRKIKQFFLQTAAVLAVIIPLFAAFPASAATTGVINVTLNPDNGGVSLVANRQGSYLGHDQFFFHKNGAVWTTGQIDSPPGGLTGCSGNGGIEDFTITATYNGGQVTANAACVIAGQTVAITMNIPQGTNNGGKGTLTGTVTVSDPNANPPTGGHHPLQGTTVTLTQEGGSNTYSYTMPLDTGATAAPGSASGKYSIGNIVPGTYTVDVTGSYNSATAQTDLPFVYQQKGVKIKAGNNTLNIAATGKTKAQASSDPTKDTTPPVTCDAGDGGFGWIICGGITIMVGWIDWIRGNIIVPFIQEKPLDRTDAGVKPVYGIWSAFRNVASVFFILIFFLVIFGTAIGWNNYTIKKILPRLIAGAILVPLSWYICVVVIDIGNVLGQGIVSLSDAVYKTSGLKAPQFDFSSPLTQGAILGTGLAGVTAVGFAAAGAVAGITWGILITVVIGFLTVFFTLVLRKVLIMMLIVLSPLALIAWILPNTNKFFSDWWKNFWKLVMMYPIIMGFFVASKLFAAVAPGILGGPANSLAIPVIQLAALVMPLFGIPLAFKMAGAGLAMGKGAIDRAGSAANGRFGKDSERAKNWTANRKQRNLLAEKKSFEKGGLGGRLQGSYNKVRGGHATGFLGTGRDVNPFHLGKKQSRNATQQMAYDKALGDAYAGQGVVSAAKRSSTLPSESHENRLAYEGQAALNKKADDRSGRAGLVSSVRENMGAGQNFEQAGNALASQRQTAGTTTTKRNESTAIGQNRAVNRGEAMTPQPGNLVAKDAELREDIKQIQQRKAVSGNIKATADLERGVMARGAAAGINVTHEEFLQSRARVHGDVAESHAIEETSAEHGAALAHGAVHNNPYIPHESTEDLVAAAYSAEREKLAATKADRTQRLEAERVRPESTSQVYQAAAETAKGKFASAKGERAAIRFAADTRPVSTETLVRAAELDSQEKLGAALGMVQGTIEAADSVARQGGYAPGSVVADQKRLLQAARSGQVAQTNKKLDTHATERAQINNDIEQRTLAVEEDRDYHADLVKGGYETASTNFGKQTGALVGAAKNANALAGTPQAPSAAKNVKAGIVAGVKAAAETAGGTAGAARVYDAATAPAASYQLAQKAGREASFSAVEGVQQARGYNEGVNDEEKRIMEETGVTREEAANQILTNVKKAGRSDGQVAGTNRVAKALGTAKGAQLAIDNEIDDAKAAGQGIIDTAQARSNILRDAAGAAEREAAGKVSGDASENRGIADTRLRATQTAAEELALQDGKNFSTLNQTDKDTYMNQAGTNIDRAADTTDYLAGQKKVTDGVAKALGTDRAYKAAVQGRIDNPDDASTTVAQARQGIVTAAVKTGEESENIRAGLAFGQDQGSVTTNEAAIERARNTIDTAITSPMDVTLEDKDADGNNIEIKAGQIIPAGTVLSEASALSLGTNLGRAIHLDRTQARAKISSRAIAAGGEKGIRDQASIQGNVAALAQAAAAEGTAGAGQRLTAYTQAELEKQAQDSAVIAAKAQETAPGKAMHLDYQKAVNEAVPIEADKILDTRINQASKRVIPYTNDKGESVAHPLNNMPMDGKAMETLIGMVQTTKASGDYATMSAALRKIGSTNGGRDKLAKLRTELFGGTPIDPATGAEDFFTKISPEDTARWDKAIEGVSTGSAADLLKPEPNAFGNITGGDLVKMDVATTKRYVSYIDRLRESAKKILAADPADAGGKAKKLTELREKALKDIRTAHGLAIDPSNKDLAGAYKNDSKTVVEAYLGTNGLDDANATSPINVVRDIYGIPLTPVVKDDLNDLIGKPERALPSTP